jgi:hypothetical protein
VADICETKSTNSFSTRLELTVPSVDMICEISLTSSSSSIFQTCIACSSPSASIRTAERSGPVRARMSSLAWVFAERDMIYTG